MGRKGSTDLIDPDNTDVLGTLTSEAWRGLAVEEIAADWYDLDDSPERLAGRTAPLRNLISKARRTSGSVKGKHREDLRDAIIGSPAQSVGFSVPPLMAGESPERDRGF